VREYLVNSLFKLLLGLVVIAICRNRINEDVWLILLNYGFNFVLGRRHTWEIPLANRPHFQRIDFDLRGGVHHLCLRRMLALVSWRIQIDGIVLRWWCHRRLLVFGLLHSGRSLRLRMRGICLRCRRHFRILISLILVHITHDILRLRNWLRPLSHNFFRLFLCWWWLLRGICILLFLFVWFFWFGILGAVVLLLLVLEVHQPLGLREVALIKWWDWRYDIWLLISAPRSRHFFQVDIQVSRAPIVACSLVGIYSGLLGILSWHFKWW